MFCLCQIEDVEDNNDHYDDNDHEIEISETEICKLVNPV